MSGPIDPIRPVRLIRRETRPAADNAAPAPTVNVTINLGPEGVEPVRGHAPPAPSLDAHMAAQGARARGLRAGQKVLETARSVYLGTEWSGPNDRRLQLGKIAKTDV